MLKPVNLILKWHNSQKAIDVFDPESPLSMQFSWPGLYLHVTRTNARMINASYVGKHTVSVVARQWEHFQSIVDGKYHLFDGNGSQTFKAGEPIPSNFIDLIEEHVLHTEVFFGELICCPPGPISNWADAVESLLQRSPSWQKNGGKILNYRKEPAVYQMHDRFEVAHQGATDPCQIFGATTIWDRQQRTVT